MREIRILQVMPEFGLAGAEIMCESLVNELSNLPDVKVYIASLYNFKSAITERLENNGVKIFYLDKKNGLDLSIVFKLFKLMKKLNINVVHTHRYVMQYAIPAADLANIPIRIHTVHSIATKEFSKPRRILASFFYRMRNVIPVSISPIVKQTMISEYKLNNIPIIYNGCDLSLCMPKYDYILKKSHTFKFINVGRLVDVKNQELIIRAVRVLIDDGYYCRVHFLGEGENLNKYKALVDELGVTDNIVFEGLKPNVHMYLNESDAFLLPSIYEGMPISLIEAMATGLPIIASNVGGIPDMIENNVNGLLINPCIDELVISMKKLINNQCLRESLGKAAKMKSIEFSSNKMMNSYYKLYKRI